MKTKAIIALGALALTACGGTKTIYVTNTEAPDNTTKVVKTTDAPIATQAPTLSDDDLFLLGVHSGYTGTIYVDDETLIDTGRATCLAFDSGATLDEVATMAVQSANGDDRILELLATVTASAVVNYCPEYGWMFE